MATGTAADDVVVAQCRSVEVGIVSKDHEQNGTRWIRRIFGTELRENNRL
jgi:hypothetical protein